MISDSLEQIAPVARERTFLRNTWYAAAWPADVAPGELFARTITGIPLVFFRSDDGSVAALHDRCSHRLAPLHRGRLRPGDRLECGYHGLQFEATGRCVLNPYGTGNIPPAAHVRSFPVRERHRLLWVWMGDLPADDALIPDFGVLDTTEPQHIAKFDYLHVNASYELVTNNLLDLSHTSFLHDGLLSNADGIGAEIKLEEDGDTVTVSRVSDNVAIPGFMKLFVNDDRARVDKWNSIRWHAPGNLFNTSGVAEPGASRASGTGIYGLHFLTPETATTTHYLFTAARWNVITPPERNDDIMRQVTDLRRYAFEYQDAPMIEGQQQRITEDPLARPVLLAVDAAPVRYARIMSRLFDREGASA